MSRAAAPGSPGVRPILVIRPQPGCGQTAAAGRALGLTMIESPLFAVEQVGWIPPDPAEVGALLLGSANAVRHAGAGLGAFCHLPVHAVGEATARAAREAGLMVASIGRGTLQEVLDALGPQSLPLLRLAGEVQLPLALPEGCRIITRIVYRSRALPLPAPLAHRLMEAGGLVLLHSAEAARHFAARIDDAGIDRAALALVALGPRIAAAAGQGWAHIAWPDTMSDEALLALACRLGYRGPRG